MLGKTMFFVVLKTDAATILSLIDVIECVLDALPMED